MNLWRNAKKWVAEITGGIVKKRLPYNVVSGNEIWLQVKYFNPIPVGLSSSRQWRWNVGNRLCAERHERMIFIGAKEDDTLEGCQIFDVPSEWVAVWYRRTISCGVGYNCWGDFGYQLYSWFTSSPEQLAASYGRGNVVPVESRTAEQEEMFQRYNRERIHRIHISLPRDVQAHWKP